MLAGPEDRHAPSASMTRAIDLRTDLEKSRDRIRWIVISKFFLCPKCGDYLKVRIKNGSGEVLCRLCSTGWQEIKDAHS